MGYITLLAILITITLLATKKLPMLSNLLPTWFASPTQNPEPKGNADGEDAGGEAEISEGDSTPKAIPSKPASVVPGFTLSEDSGNELEESDEASPSVPMFPAANSAQRASALSPASKTGRSSAALMPPPALPKPGGLRPNPAPSLRVPSTGPLPNRGPPMNSQQRASAGLAPNAPTSVSNARGKVILSPGHSPMDWAALTRKGNVSGVDSFQRVTPSQLRTMTGRKGKPAWSSWQGKVYNITPYLPFHPGGEAELMKAAGRDGTKLFNDVHPWVNWENMLSACLVGVLVPDDYAKSPLEDMD